MQAYNFGRNFSIISLIIFIILFSTIIILSIQKNIQKKQGIKNIEKLKMIIDNQYKNIKLPKNINPTTNLINYNFDLKTKTITLNFVIDINKLYLLTHKVTDEIIHKYNLQKYGNIELKQIEELALEMIKEKSYNPDYLSKDQLCKNAIRFFQISKNIKFQRNFYIKTKNDNFKLIRTNKITNATCNYF